MGRPLIDLTGQRFGKLVVVERAENAIRKSDGQIIPRWLCQCDCGNTKIVRGFNLKSGNIKSCGCISKIPNLIGQKFGQLTIKSMFYKGKKAYYNCSCDCGNSVDVFRNSLINGKQYCCHDCLPKERPGQVKDLSGQRFGRLVALRRDSEKYYSAGGKRIYKYICQCDCGRIVSVARGTLKDGKTISCGCYQAEIFGMTIEEYDKAFEHARRTNNGLAKDLAGMRFGRLVARCKVENNTSNKTQWLCHCDCGGIAVVATSNLTNGHTQSCGCIDSVGESAISMYLDKRGINYLKEKTYSDCRDNHPLPFDFGIKKDKKVVALIEYDGLQHFEPVRFNGMTEESALSSFEDCKRHDAMKNKYCEDNDIPLLRIKYDEKDNLESILDAFLKDVI